MANFKLAICNELFEGWPLAKVCGFACDLGYQGLEIAPFTLANHPQELTQLARSEVAKTVAGAGMEIVGLHWLLAKTSGLHLTCLDRKMRIATRDYMRALVELCSDLSGRILVLGSPQQRSFPKEMSQQEANQHAAEVLVELASDLISANVVLALEPLGPEETNFWNTAADTCQFIEELAVPNIQLHLDVKAMSTENLAFHEIIGNSGSHLVHFHANDPNRQGPGMGSVNYEHILPALSEVGYDGWLSVEVFDYSLGAEHIARASAEYLLSLMRK